MPKNRINNRKKRVDQGPSGDNENHTEDAKSQKADPIPPHSDESDRTPTPQCNYYAKEESENWPNRTTAICTAILVFITGFYTHYAGGQLGVMQDQLNLAKAVNSQTIAKESAQLVLEDFSSSIMETDRYVFIRGTFKIRNVGGTVAKNVGAQVQHSVSPEPPQPPPEAHPNRAIANGPILGPGSLKEVPFDYQVEKSYISTKILSMSIDIGYQTIFDDPKIEHYCLIYSPADKTFGYGVC